MRKNILISSFLITIGITIGVLLVSNFNSDSLESAFAQENTEIGAANSPVKQNEFIRQLNAAYVDVSDAVLPSVVSISVESSFEMDPRMQQFFEYFYDKSPREDQEFRRSKGAGSGVIISEDGYIVTNNHVVEGALEDGIDVMLSDKKSYKAEVIGVDPLTDLAVLKIDAEGLTPAHFENSDKIKIGQPVVAVGSPLGLNQTVTSGIISAMGRGKLGLNRRGEQASYAVENFIQTDAAINPGNSGGGLFNLNGSLVGINTAIASETGSYIGYGFAIPIDLVKSVVEDLIDNGNVNRGYIGVRINSVEDEQTANYLKLDKVGGVLIVEVIPGSAGEKAGLQAEDVILEVDGKFVSTSGELQSEVAKHRAGDQITLSISRDGDLISKKITLKANEDLDQELAATADKSSPFTDKPLDFDELGFKVKPIDDITKKELEVENGVIITEVEKYSVAEERGLLVGGVIHKADKQQIKTTGELREIIESKNEGDVLGIQMIYRSVNTFVALTIPQKEG
jgi:serine protease Do